MSKFPHLELVKKIDGSYRAKRSKWSKEINQITKANLDNRNEHANRLLSSVNNLSSNWQNNLKLRLDNNLPQLPNPEIVPVFLQIDTEKCDIESLKSFGIEIVAEEEGGFIIGASSEDFISLRKKIEKFIQESGQFRNKASQLWEINEGIQWRVEQILSDDLKEKWSSIQDGDEFIVDVGIACYVKPSERPTRKAEEADERFDKRLNAWRQRKNEMDEKREERAMIRQTEFEDLVHGYGGELSSYVDFDDSYSCRIKISGKGLKDIVLNYQYLFEVVEHDSLVIQNTDDNEAEDVLPELLPPDENSATVCIIDSGIQEGHRLLVLAMDHSNSKSFVPGDLGTADIAKSGGHGTRVAGAVLYPNKIPRNGVYTLPCFIQNARVLISDNGSTVLPDTLYPPKLMREIVAHFENTRIFNMSINSYSACKLVHMSQWATSIDKLMFEKDIMFIVSAGNINSETNSTLKPGIKEHLISGREYPGFLLENSSRIGNPAQSCFALTVGSICYEKFDDGTKESFGGKDHPSPFSRSGLGLWGMIKPDVVEYGGDFVKEKGNNPNISREALISPELVRSTVHGGSAVGRDEVGTSFAAPKVSHIVANLQKLYPSESSNLYRALVAQSARLPEEVFADPTIDHIRHYGYGIPNLERATQNSEKRVTLVASDHLSATQSNIYSIKIPNEVIKNAEEYNVLIEVTLSFMACPRRTRRRTQSYLSTWLSWESSKTGETQQQFSARILKDMGESEGENDSDTIKWVIRENKKQSKVNGIRRQDSTLQKSWCVMKSYELPDVLNIAVIGHKGWESDLQEEVPYSVAVSVEALNADINLYEIIRLENEISIEIEQEIKNQ